MAQPGVEAAAASVAIVFGIAALVWPGVTLEMLVLLFGAYAFIDGVSISPCGWTRFAAA